MIEYQIDLFTNKPSIKWYVINEIPNIESLHQNSVLGFNSENLDDQQLVKAWKAVNISNYLLRFNIEPKGFIYSRHKHLLSQVGSQDLLNIVNEEMKSRKLDLIYGIDIELLHHSN